MKKRLLSILLALCLVAGLLPTVALADETPSYSIENGTLVISGTTDGLDLPTEGFTSIKITETGVVTGGTYTVDVDNYGTITGGEFGFVMNRNGGAGSSLALITGGTFEEVSNYGNMTGGTVKTLSNIETTNTQHTVQGVTVTGSLYNSNSNCNDMTLLIDLTSVTNNLSITTVRQVVNGTEVLCPVGQNAASWLKSNVANADWYQLNSEEWVKLTDTDVFPCEKRVYSKIPGMSLGTMGSMQDIISGNWIVPVADSENPNAINPVFNGKIGVFNSSAVWYVDGQPVEGKFSPPAMSYTVTKADIGKDAVAKLTDGYATIQSPTIRIVKSLSVTVPATSAVGETITPVFNWQLKTNYSEGMTYQWQRDGVDIEGAASYTYTATESDLNHKLTLKIFVKGTPYYITDKVAVATLHTHCICGGDTAVGDHTSHTDVIYQPWDGTSAIDYGDDNTAYVYLTDNVTIQKSLEIQEGKTLYLCLNGKTFASNGTTKIEMQENSHFILCDCAGGGTIDGADSCWGGAGIYLHNSTMDMYGGKITGGHTGNGGGGAIALDDVNCVFNMYGGEISGNKADRYAGAIFLNGTLQTKKGGTVNLYGGTIKNNRAQIGGAIYAVYGGTVNLFGGEISGNKATVNGGGAICLNHSGVLNMTGGKMQNNTAKTDGGAVNLFASTFTFSGGTISNNYSAEYGGAVYLSISGKMNMTGGEICNNTAKEEGGAVHVYGENATFNFSGGTITGNEAVDGGAVYLNQENSTLNMTGGEISGNKATGNGGAVYMFRATSTLNLSGGTIKNNTAGSSGGAVYFNTTSDSKIQGILNISGNPVVKDNTVSDKANNISLKTGKTLSIVEAMTDGASVGITTESTDYPVVFSNAYDTDYSGYFFADDANAHVNYNSEKKLELAADVPAHTHSWSEDWSKNETHHWHDCTADGCDVTENSGKDGYAAHTYDQEIATADYKASDATCTAKATYYKSCVCGAKGTETFKSGEVNTSNHTFGEWINEVPATCVTRGTMGHKTCTSCGKHFDASDSEITDLTIPVDSANHEGTLGDWVKTDPDKHWKVYSCCGATVNEAAHDYDSDADADCNTCGYFRTIESAHTHCVCGGDTAVGDHTSHTDVTWTGVSSLGEITGTGSYYLTDDILMSSDLRITGTVNLCLNGHQIYTQSGVPYGTVKIQTGAALNVCDCSEDESGLITTCRGSYAIENSGTLNLYSGSVERSSDDNEAAVKVNAGAVFHMYSGKIGGNAKAIIAEGEVNAFGGTVSAKRQAMEVYAGSNVTVSGNAELSVTGTGYSTIAVYGGTVNICGGTVTNASGVAVYVPSGESSTLNISDGEISTSSSAKKDTILLASDSAEVTVTGGSITNGYPSPATSGSSIYGWAIGVYNVKSLTISGAPEINRIYLAENRSITVGEDGLTYETPIEIHCAKCPAPVTGANDTDYSSKFTPRSIFYAIINAADNVVLFTKAATVTYTDGVDGEKIFPDQPHSTYLGQPTPAFNGTLQRTGYTFAGWYTDTDYTEAYDFNTPVTGNLTLYAKWTVNQYTITFNTNGGTAIAPITQDYGTAITAPENPTKTGYTFAGWEPELPETMPAGNLTIKAKWTVNQYTITFDTDGGSEVASITKDYGTAITAPENPTKTGYTFNGWDTTIPDTMPANNMTITAKWTINQYTITYDLDGGTVEGNPDSYTVETDTFTLNNPTKRGYTFTGWSGTGLTGENNLTVTIEKGSTGDRNYTAHWRYNGSYIPTYPITVESARHGDVTSSHKSASKGTTVTITVEPDKGYTLETITVTDASGDEIELTNKGDGKYTFKMPASKVYVEATFMEDNSMLNFFVDVPANAYYYDAVLWAAENGITGGVDDTHFAPNAPCTRAQAVTFLWRAAGSPAPKSSEMPFEDVVKGSYYYDAVSWAVENGITKGTSDTTFSPDATCTRGQIVTFLWRAQQSPAAGSTNPFADVAADAYYADAVLWAVREDITNGTSSTTFSPDATCTRAQIVTFLYRCLTGE